MHLIPHFPKFEGTGPIGWLRLCPPVWYRAFSCICDLDCLLFCAIKGKQVELSTPKSVDILVLSQKFLASPGTFGYR